VAAPVDRDAATKASIAREWVEAKVNKTFVEERSRKEVVLFPIRIDNTVISTYPRRNRGPSRCGTNATSAISAIGRSQSSIAER
jgi:hypothetical protein